MACLLKAPAGNAKGCVVFTTPERDNTILASPATEAAVRRLKSKYLVGLHHNWHDYSFTYNPLFDFSLAGDGDLIEVNNAEFSRIPLDACNFSPDAFLAPRAQDPFWDILYVARAVAFKGIPEFLRAIRSLYDTGHLRRVLFICPTPKEINLPGIDNLRDYFEAMFNAHERQFFTLLTIDWDYPFPLDLESLAFFYRNSRIFLHPAPEERRCRTAAYAWANRMPVVANRHVASILPKEYHKPPYLFEYTDPAGIAAAIVAALENASQHTEGWRNVSGEFAGTVSATRIDDALREIAITRNLGEVSASPIIPRKLDIRLGRHHELAVGGNRIDYPIEAFCDVLLNLSDATVADILQESDPEIALGQQLDLGLFAHVRPTASANVSRSRQTDSTWRSKWTRVLATVSHRWTSLGGGR